MSPRSPARMPRSSPPAPAWKVRLDGHPFDLDDARTAASGLSGVAIEEEGDGWFLRSSEFAKLRSPADVAHEAERALCFLNAITRAHSEGSKPIRVDAVADAAG